MSNITLLSCLKFSNSIPLIPERGKYLHAPPKLGLLIYPGSLLTLLQLRYLLPRLLLTHVMLPLAQDLCVKCFRLDICKILSFIFHDFVQMATGWVKLFLKTEPHFWKSLSLINYLHCFYQHGHTIHLTYLFYYLSASILLKLLQRRYFCLFWKLLFL